MTVDINTPQSPVLVSTIPLSGASGITLQGNLAYVAQGQNGLTVMDINQPANPRKAGSIYTPGAAINTEVKGDYIYLNDQYGGLLVIKQTLQPFYELFLPSVMRPT
jgi:hypothetical protein